jgi:hypothetical protein
MRDRCNQRQCIKALQANCHDMLNYPVTACEEHLAAGDELAVRHLWHLVSVLLAPGALRNRYPCCKTAASDDHISQVVPQQTVLF